MSKSAVKTASFPGTGVLPGNVQVEVIDASVAMAYLNKNAENNRRANRSLVQRYAADMRNGRWRAEVMDPIRFDSTDRLIDGQHRLMAIVDSGVAQTMLVIRGIDPSTIHMIDTGRARSPADMLKIKGYHNTTLFAAGLRALLVIKESPVTAKTPAFFSHSEILAVAERHEGMLDSCAKVRAIRGIRPAPLVAMHYIIGQILGRPDKAAAFMAGFNDGVVHYEGDPIHLYRERLLRERDREGVYTAQVYFLMGLMYVWNHFAEDRPLALLRVPKQVSINDLDVNEL